MLTSTCVCLLQGAEQVTHFCRRLHEKDPDGVTYESAELQPKPLSESQRIRKVIIELIETERQYVKVSGRGRCVQRCLRAREHWVTHVYST